MYRRFYDWNGVGRIVCTVYNLFSKFCPIWGRGCYTSGIVGGMIASVFIFGANWGVSNS